MGIHIKYNLTKFAYQSREPETKYSCDSYSVSFFFEYRSDTIKESFNTWEEANKYFLANINTISNRDDFVSFGIEGLVYN